MKMMLESKLTKVFLSSSLLILVTFVHTILRISKDILVISYLGAEVISAIKIWFILPLTFLFMLGYLKLANLFSRKHLSQGINWFLIAFFVLFILVIYPNFERLRWTSLEHTWLSHYASLRYVLSVLVNWPFSLFYFFAEMWVTIMLSIVTWQVVNHISTETEARKFYPWFGSLASIGSLGGSFLVKYLAKYPILTQSLRWLTFSIVVAGGLISASLFFLGKLIDYKGLNHLKVEKKQKPSLKQGLKLILNSRAIALIATLLFCFNVTINLIEGVWKKSFENLFNHDAIQIQAFMGNVNIYISLFSGLFALLGYYLLKKFSWRTVAFVCPAVFLVFGGGFFCMMIGKYNFNLWEAGVLSMQGVVYLGALHNIFAHASKRALFDATKEMAYLPLNDELKNNGKVVAELIGTRMGKGFGALIQQVLLAFSILGNDLLTLTPIIGILYFLLMFLWFFAVKNLAKIL